VFPGAGNDRVGQDSGTGERAGDPEGAAQADDPFDGLDGPTRRLLPVPVPQSVPHFLSIPELTAPEPADQEDPLELSALRADDEMLTELAMFGRSMTGSDADLAAMLRSWRLDVDAEPIRELVDTDTAMATIAVGARINRRRPRYLVPLATAAAVLVVVFGGMGMAARDAEPGDALWGLSQVLYSDHARSVEAAASVRSDLHHASEALQQGHFGEARTALVQAQASLPSVDNSDGKANLQAQQQTLLNQLDSTTGPPSVTSTPNSGVAPVSSTSTTPPPTTTTTPPPSTTTTPPPSTSITTPSPTPTTTPSPTTTDTASPQSDTLQGSPAQPGGSAGQPAVPPANPAQPNQPAAGDNAVTDNTAGTGS
jgi:hypothetical protein